MRLLRPFQIAKMIQTHLHPLVKTQMTFGAVEAVYMELTVTEVPDGVIDGEDNMTGRTSGPKHSVEVLFAVELTKFCEAGSIKFTLAHLAFEAIFMDNYTSSTTHTII